MILIIGAKGAFYAYPLVSLPLLNTFEGCYLKIYVSDQCQRKDSNHVYVPSSSKLFSLHHICQCLYSKMGEGFLGMLNRQHFLSFPVNGQKSLAAKETSDPEANVFELRSCYQG